MTHVSPQLLLRAYQLGIFPMADSANAREVNWYEPTLRGVLPIEGFRLSKNVQRLYRNGSNRYSINKAFQEVVKGCADRPETWINPIILSAYTALHHAGHAHSVEVWDDEELVGGLYGVSLGGAFMGESMFRRRPEADKLALWHCRNRLMARGFVLWDAQFWTEHLAQFGCQEIKQAEYLLHLSVAADQKVSFDP
jgi:leucyl/phenylalanyl-tRNA---protein transferase